MKKPNPNSRRRDLVKKKQAKLAASKRKRNANRLKEGMKKLQGGLPKGFKLTAKEQDLAVQKKALRRPSEDE